ncbi:MAG: UDP-N-acetylmuramate dehydrogenase, partial [Patescibacteria group bacterium]|nr:UDP-N-acetylmuramate dehydrogenase [Patescibacteria group bacterium]
MDTQKDENKPLELFKTDQNLSFFSTLKVGGAAKFFVTVQSEEEVQNAFNFALKEGLPVFVLGGGSNVLFSDEGFKGVVIKNEI